MIVLKIIGIILLSILLLVFLLLIFPVKLVLKNSQDDLKLLLKYTFLTFDLNSNSDNKLAKNLLKKPKKDKTEKTDKLDSKKEKKKLTETIKDNFSLISEIIEQALKLFKHIKINKIHLECVCAGEDAATVAMEYGTSCAIIYPLIGYLHSITKIAKRKEKINIICDFNSKNPIFNFEIVISILPIFVILGLLKVLKGEVNKKVKEANK